MAIWSIIKLFVLVLTKIISHCGEDLTCAVSDPPVDLSPPDIMRALVTYIEMINFDPIILEDILVTEIEVLKQVTSTKQVKNNEDIDLNVTQLIEKYGYKTEEYEVVTSDGYILSLQRIPGKGKPVFLMHGTFNSADDFITGGPKGALGYALASQGYDVWLGNARGNKHSRKHKTLSPECAEFWDFSFHEIGVYDLPAMIDFALDKSGQTRLTYIGVSKGTTTSFVLNSLLPEYNSKISLIIALAPMAYVSHMALPFAKIGALETGLLYKFLMAIGVSELSPSNAVTKALLRVVCGENALAQILCSNSLFLGSGFDRGQLNVTNLPVVMGHIPAGASTKIVAHYAQEVESGKFRMFDYGKKINKEVYGVPKPPEYPVEKISAPVALFYSQNDKISSHIDVEILRKHLPNVVKYQLVDKYCHFDFMYAINLEEKINKPILELIRQYE